MGFTRSAPFRFAGSSTGGTPVAERPALSPPHMHETISVTASLPHSGAEERPAAPPTYRDLVSGAGWIACLDSLGAVVGILGVLISVNMSAIPGGVDSFLSHAHQHQERPPTHHLGSRLASSFPALRPLRSQTRSAASFRSRASRPRDRAGTALAAVFPLTSVSGSLASAICHVSGWPHLGLCLLVRSGRRAVDRAQNGHVRRALIVGTGRLAQRIHRDLQINRPDRYHVVGFVDEPSDTSRPLIGFKSTLCGSTQRGTVDA